MYVKLAFSVAAHLDSEIMIMDEVLAVGDMAFQKKCLDKMRDAAKKEGRTVLYVSHNMNTIRQLCDRCIVLDKGRIVFQGDVEEAIQNYLGVTSDVRNKYVYTDNFHSDSRSRHSKFRMISMEMNHVDESRFAPGEIVDMTLRCSAQENYSGIFLRYEIQTLVGQVFATALTGSVFDIQKGQEKDISIKLDTSHLTAGGYRANIIAYLVNEFGVEQFIDGVYPGIEFEIVDAPNENCDNLVWLARYWGHIRLNDLEIGQ